MSVTERPREAVAADVRRDAVGTAPVTLEVRDLKKSFRVPEHRIDTFKERAVHPFSRPNYRDLHALGRISFDVHKGEFFGIVGRNGSGKSTLLKILASIYRADGGTIRMAGRLAPFIELGVGFNPDLTARENVVLNAVMMGLTPREARARIDAVFEFAELQDFTELKLKNYSSGMSVRLAFSVMLQADADILLIDEVLAVGDAAFQQKCTDVFHEMRDSDKTVILVTHDMRAIETYCHRAMLLHDGEMQHIGDPEEISRRYLRLNFGGHEGIVPAEPGRFAAVPDLHARLVDAGLEGAAGDPVANVEQGEPIRFHAVIEARTEIREPLAAIHCVNAEGVQVFSVHHPLEEGTVEPGRLAPGERVQISGTIENPLTNGRYELSCWVTSKEESGRLAVQELHLFDFVVFGPKLIVGTIAVDAQLRADPVTRSES
jgi:ABC-type polysaccharide/polyol phosphate transport system ATPase subunit